MEGSMKKKRKLAFIITILCIIGTMILVSRNLLISIFTLFLTHKDIKDISAIGIIGAADGPTSIIVASKNHFGLNFFDILTISFACISFLGILYLLNSKKKL
jgi:Na+-transporting methylmalonyl-CoA/oxaloacetate decarboxylase beta subunit